ncbi:MAG: hypothetical protein ACJA0Q_001211 [Saprospiraceae bacterium]|jgi:hypothetical protein
MKYSSLILSFLAIVFLSACGDSITGSKVDGEEQGEETSMTLNLEGIFIQNNDTLRVVTIMDNFGKSIGFDITATREETVKAVSTEAPLVDQSSKMEHYRLKNWISGDSAYVAYELIDFTFNFDNDNWTIADTVVITDHDAPLPFFTDLSGTYLRVK